MTRDLRVVGGVWGLFFVSDFALDGGGGIYYGLLKECRGLDYLAGGWRGGGTIFCLVERVWGVLGFLIWGAGFSGLGFSDTSLFGVLELLFFKCPFYFLFDFLIHFDLGDTLGLFTTIFYFCGVLTFLAFSGLYFFAFAYASSAFFYASTTLLSVVCIITGPKCLLTEVFAAPFVIFYFFFITVYIL